jgi:hypothetical protein
MLGAFHDGPRRSWFAAVVMAAATSMGYAEAFLNWFDSLSGGRQTIFVLVVGLAVSLVGWAVTTFGPKAAGWFSRARAVGPRPLGPPPIRVDRIECQLEVGKRPRVLVYATVTADFAVIRRGEKVGIMRYGHSFELAPGADGGTHMRPAPVPTLADGDFQVAVGETAQHELDNLANYSPQQRYAKGEHLFDAEGDGVLKLLDKDAIEAHLSAGVFYARWFWADRPDAVIDLCSVLLSGNRVLPAIRLKNYVTQ